MINNINSYKYCLPCERIDIYCLRIFAEKVLRNEPIFFNVISGVVKPVDICIDDCFYHPYMYENQVAKMLLLESRRLDYLIKNNVSTEKLLKNNQRLSNCICNLKPKEHVHCIKIERVKVKIIESTSEILCSCSKVRIKIKYKMFIYLRLSNGKCEIITMPNDEGKKYCFNNNVKFPIEYTKDDIQKVLNKNKYFELIIDVPIKSFDGFISPEILECFILSNLAVKNIKSNYTVLNDKCCCNKEFGTHITIKSSANIIDDIGIIQDSMLCGVPIDFLFS